ncbi:MAG: GTPase ObgE [Defluviitaleaceae bacterium]|nr:GTPase ObgE [Defluviitaleaceae bacterium]MCL2263174.1 GTPase ObgE [Defluviitaleaceae bacterium]
MFIDNVKITIESGRGGHGHISFRREKYVPNGGPDGGDGGRGGDIVFVADTGVNTLTDFRYKKKFHAEDGVNGGGSKCKGRNGNDLILKVPVGTLVRYGWEANETGNPTGLVMADLKTEGEHRILAKGGRGGRGNQHFATPSRQAPKFCEDGKPGKSYQVTLELKLIADVGIIGFPNAGKSTLLSRVTKANPKIANYQFTTLSPNLGVVRHEFGRDFVLADIPGLIEGASQGVGLGFDFLRHIERTRMLLHVVDAARLEDDLTPVEAIEKINAELAAFNPTLLERPQIIAANKADLPLDETQIADLKAFAAEKGWQVVLISAATNSGMEELIRSTAKMLETAPETADFEPDYETYFEPERAQESITVEKIKDGLYSVEGPAIERLLGYTNMADERGFAFFQRFLRERGIIDRLEELGIQENDTVQLYELQFDYWK